MEVENKKSKKNTAFNYQVNHLWYLLIAMWDEKQLTS